MKKVFFDTNLMLDSALERGENGVAATAILSACEYGEIEGCLSCRSPIWLTPLRKAEQNKE